jgi:hypothetical protein
VLPTETAWAVVFWVVTLHACVSARVWGRESGLRYFQYSDYTALDSRIHKCWIRKDLEGSGPGLIGVLSLQCLRAKRKTMKDLRPGQDSNQGPSELKSTALPLDRRIQWDVVLCSLQMGSSVSEEPSVSIFKVVPSERCYIPTKL